MKLITNEVVYALSVALDVIEGEIAGATTYHAQRVAHFCVKMGEYLGLSPDERVDLAAAAVLHDNAITEYVQDEIFNGAARGDVKLESALGRHCAMGEKNICVLPFYERARGAVLYHHERADGNGPFKKTIDQIPLYARLIHMADGMDVNFNFSNINPEKYQRMRDFIAENTGTLYDAEVADAFVSAITLEDLQDISGRDIVTRLFKELPRKEYDYTSEQLIGISDMFAKIIDYKSSFTYMHSRGIAQKARDMAAFYGWDQTKQDQIYFAGALHDIGKLLVSNDILEKPGKLTEFEYEEVKNHAMGSYMILHSIEGMGKVADWAALHHEKLDGTGYPLGLTGKDLSKEERLMAVIDIYQALVEPRPYKDGLPHKTAMEIIGKMVAAGQLDPDIAADVDRVFGTDSVDNDPIPYEGKSSYEAVRENLKDEEDVYRCPVCGYRLEGPPPENFICPLCEQPGTIFEKV